MVVDRRARKPELSGSNLIQSRSSTISARSSTWRGVERSAASATAYELALGPATMALFIRGDCNDDGRVDISDAVSVLAFLFLGGGEPGCEDACDSNDSGAADLSDVIHTFGVLFRGEGTIPLPGRTAYGEDSTGGDEAGCDRHESCP